MADVPSDDSHASDHDAPGSPRPEQLLEDWGRRAGRFLAAAASRVREEAEDIWAEAQSVKRGERE